MLRVGEDEASDQAVATRTQSSDSSEATNFGLFLYPGMFTGNSFWSWTKSFTTY